MVLQWFSTKKRKTLYYCGAEEMLRRACSRSPVARGDFQLKRILSFVFLSCLAAAAFASSSTMPDGTEFPMWENTLHFSKTYYVDCQARNADDSGLGTREHPFRTIN